MSLSLGEIEAVLKARDELTAIVRKASGEMAGLGASWWRSDLARI